MSIGGKLKNADTGERVVPVLLVDTTGAGYTGGGGGGGGGGAVTIADGADVALGATTQARSTNPDANNTLIQFIKGIFYALTTRLPISVGPQNGTGSLSVVQATAAPFTITPYGSGFIDHSGLTGDTATPKSFMTGNARRYFLFQNLSTVNLYINAGSLPPTGAGSIRVVPGATYIQDGTCVSQDAWYVVPETGTNQPYTAKEIT